MKDYYALIMAGGGGTRLWPMSRQETPKQMLPLINHHSMYKTSVNRLAPVFPPEKIYVVAGRNHIPNLRAETPEIPVENFIVEPYGKDNAPAVGLAIAVIEKRHPEATIAIMTADHHIAFPHRFCNVLANAYDIAGAGHIVTLGISPAYPATGFGYIKQGDELGDLDGMTYYVAEKFTEKPDRVRATQFLASGQYSWNSGMFIWTARQAMMEFKKQQSTMYKLLEKLQPVIDTVAFSTTLDEIWEEMPRISIDFAIMEDAQNMVVIPVDIGWSDVGTWASLFDVLSQDKFGNCAKGKVADNKVILDTRNTLVYSDRLAVTIGVEDIVIVDTDDILLICHKDRSEDVRQVVKYLKETGKDQYL